MITEYRRYMNKPVYTAIQLSTMTNSELKDILRTLKFHPMLVQTVSNFRTLRIKQILRDQIKLFETELVKRNINIVFTTADRQAAGLSKFPATV